MIWLFFLGFLVRNACGCVDGPDRDLGGYVYGTVW